LPEFSIPPLCGFDKRRRTIKIIPQMSKLVACAFCRLRETKIIFDLKAKLIFAFGVFCFNIFMRNLGRKISSELLDAEQHCYAILRVL
jgi:hypothetical protein